MNIINSVSRSASRLNREKLVAFVRLGRPKLLLYWLLLFGLGAAIAAQRNHLDFVITRQTTRTSCMEKYSRQVNLSLVERNNCVLNRIPRFIHDWRSQCSAHLNFTPKPNNVAVIRQTPGATVQAAGRAYRQRLKSCWARAPASSPRRTRQRPVRDAHPG